MVNVPNTFMIFITVVEGFKVCGLWPSSRRVCVAGPRSGGQAKGFPSLIRREAQNPSPSVGGTGSPWLMA